MLEYTLHLPPVAQGVLAISAVALAVVRLLTASRPFWAWEKVPVWVQKLLPALLMALAALPTAIEHARSWLDIIVALVVAGSMWFTASRGDKRPPVDGDGGPRLARSKTDPKVERISFQRPPSDPNIAAITSLHRRRSGWRWLRVTFESYRPRAPRWVPTYVLLLLAALLIGCGSHISWPAALQCGAPLEQPLLQTVASVLAGTGDVKTELEQVAVDHGAVECAVQQLISDIGMASQDPQRARSVARGRAFLASVQQ